MSAPENDDHPFRTTPLLRTFPKSLTIHDVRQEQTLDYEALEARVAETTQRIRDQNADQSNRIVIGASDPLTVIVSLFATWAAKHCAVLVNPNLTKDEQQRVSRKVTPRLWIDDTGLRIVDGPTENSEWPDAALILMTSGTTGDPKGVTHSLETLEARLKLNVTEIGTDVLAQTLCPLPLFFGHGLIGNCLTTLYGGQNLHILDAPTLPELKNLGAFIDQNNITFLSSVPSMWRMVLRLSAPPKRPLTRVHVGSAPLPHALWNDIATWCGTKRVLNTYGMTETANWISGGTCPETDADGFVGHPWGGSFRVLRDNNLHLEGRGEVAINSPSMMLGLWGTEQQPDVKQGYFLTGDIGELNPDQTLRLVGRTKNEINRGGIKVLAEEVDMLLERHDDVAEACSFGIPDEIAGEVVGAVVRLNADAEQSTAALVQWCRTQARAEAVPHKLAIVDEIAKTDRGKLARQKIQEEMIRTWS